MKHRARSRTIPSREPAKVYKNTPTQARLMAEAIATAEHGIVHAPGERRDYCERCKKACRLCGGSGRVTHPEAGDLTVACGYCLGTGREKGE